MNIKIFCRCSLFPSWSGYGLISTLYPYFKEVMKSAFAMYIGNSLTYSLTPWSRVLLQKLTGLQLVKKFPAFYGTRRFITAVTNVRHYTL